MNKKLLALALTSAFALPMAAQAETTLYGLFNLSYDSARLGTDRTPTTANPYGVSASFNGLSSSNSRLGVKGEEALGGGLNAVYQVESGFSATTGQTESSWGGLATRNTFAGLNNKSFGTVWFGRMDTPYKRATGGWDYFADSVGDMNNIVNNAKGGVFGSFHQRLNRSIGYDGAWSGFYTNLQVGTQEPISNTTVGTVGVGGATTTVNNGSGGVAGGAPKFSTLSGLIGYRFYGFDVNYSIEQNRNITAALPGSGITVATPLPGTTVGTGAAAGSWNRAKAQQVGISYTFPAQTNYLSGANLAAVYEWMDSDLTSAKPKDWWVQASVPFVGGNSVGVSYGKAQSTALSGSANQVAVGAKHNFTKNTSAYLVYARMHNDAGASYSLGTDHGDVGTPNTSPFALVGGAGNSQHAVSLGMITKF